jgi:hypothetical protein
VCADAAALAVVVVDFDPFFAAYYGAVWAVYPADEAVGAFFFVYNRSEGSPVACLVL